MSDQNELPVQDELTMLKQRAKQVGLKFHPTISTEKLRAKLQAHLDGEPDPTADEEAPVKESKQAQMVRLRAEVRKEASKLVRIRITNMNPTKKDWPGEVITVSNKVISEKKFIPFTGYEDGYHVPHIIYEMLKSRKFQQFSTRKLPNGGTTRDGKLVNEFAIEVLPPLTKEEIANITKAQAAEKTF